MNTHNSIETFIETFLIQKKSQLISLKLTFVAGALSIALATPIQILMIRTAAEAEMLGAAAKQAAFKIGNALGDFFGGLPMAAVLGFNSPSMVGAAMALSGTFFAWLFYQKAKNFVKRKVACPGSRVESFILSLFLFDNEDLMPTCRNGISLCGVQQHFFHL